MHSPHLLHGQSLSSAIADPNESARYRAAPTTDAEAQTLAYVSPVDPLNLLDKKKAEAEIESIKANTKRKRNALNPLVISGKRPASKLASFYETQNEQIERFLKPVHEHVREAREEGASNHLQFQIAVYASFGANIILAVLQLYGAISSGSLSLFTTMADAVFDPLSNLTLILCSRAIMRVDSRKFPAGKARIETAGNICFCFLMTAVSFILIAFSAREIADGMALVQAHSAHPDEPAKYPLPDMSFHLPAVIAVGIAFGTKLALFLYCWTLRNIYSQIRILWEDHRNDLLINGFGILTSIGGSKLQWWIDPMGAIILSILISVLWLHTAYSEFQLLIGKSADTETLQLITYVSMTHSPLIKQIDTVRAWHSGPRLVVEVDVVMEPEESLRVSHDVAEELQMKLESLPDVERAYVHVDFETTHKPEHFLKKEL